MPDGLRMRGEAIWGRRIRGHWPLTPGALEQRLADTIGRNL